LFSFSVLLLPLPSSTLFPYTTLFRSDVFLELCFAVILPAIGSAIVFNIGASTGGTDIVAMILSKYTSLEVGRALMLSDLGIVLRSEEHTSELQSRFDLVCRLLLEKKK